MLTTAPLLGEPIGVELMNTVWADREGRHDALADDGGVEAWLASVAPRLGVALDSAAMLSRPTVDSFRELRDALRTLAASVTADSRLQQLPSQDTIATALAVLNAACASAPAWSALRHDGDSYTRTSISGSASADAALATIAEESVALFGGAMRSQLRACHGPACTLYFVRQHGRREWCSAGCGNRARVARHYRRHHVSSASQRRGSVSR